MMRAWSNFGSVDARVAAAARATAATALLLVTARSWIPIPFAAPVSSIALGLSIIMLVVGCVRTAYSSTGLRRPLFTGLAIAAVAGMGAQVHTIVTFVLPGIPPRFPNPGLWLLVLGTNPTLAATFALAIGGRRSRKLRGPELLDVALVVTAAAIVAVLLARLSPWPGATTSPEISAMMLLWRCGMIAALGLAALLIVMRADALGSRMAIALACGTVLLELAHGIMGREALATGMVDATANDPWWALALFAFALALPAPLAGDRTAALLATDTDDDWRDDEEERLIARLPELRGRAVVAAIVITSATALVLAFDAGRNPVLGVGVAGFGAMLAVRAAMVLAAERDARRILAGSVREERQLSSTLEQRVAERTTELAEAQRVLQRMWTLGQQITLELNPDRVLHRFIEAVVDVAGADGGSLGLMSESGALGMLSDTGRLRIVVSTGQGAPLTGTVVPVAGSAMGRAVLTGKPWTHHDVTGEPGLVYQDSLRRAPDVGGLLVVPLHRRGERIGAVAVSSRKPRVFTPAEIARVEAMADLLTVSLSNAELVENLRQAEWRFRTLFRAAPDVVLTLLQSGRVREANEAVREVTGLEPANIVGRMLSDVVMEDDRQALTDAIARTFEGAATRCEVRLQRENGPPHVVALAASRLPEADPPSVLVIGRDVTAEREMRARLVETERLAAVGELVAGVAHEVNNPLSSISAFAQLLLRDPSLVDAQRDSLEVIKAETARASQVVKDLLAFARRSEHRQEPIDLNVLIERTLRLRGFQLNAANVRVDLSLTANLPSVLGDARQLQQVLLNLIANAVQAMTRTGGGVLRLATRALEGAVVLEVCDTGTGIPASARPHIFEPFFTTKREGEGTGLGLSVSYGIVTAHGGSIGIADTSERGTTMVVSLPAVSQPAARARASAEYAAVAAPRSPLAGLKLLVVDDEASLRSGIEAYGKLRGFGVVLAASGEEALTVLETTSVDAVVCDLRMPGMDGTALHEILRRERPGLAQRTVFMTGDVIGAAFRSGTLSRQPVVMKPFALERLEDVVVAVLRGDAMTTAGSR